MTALLTIPVGALGGEIAGRFATAGVLDSGYGGFLGAKRAIWVGLLVGIPSVLWGHWQARLALTVQRVEPR